MSRSRSSVAGESTTVELETITTVFRPVLVQYVDPNSVLLHLTVLRFTLGDEFRDIHEASLRSQSEGMTVLLAALQRLSPEDRKGKAKEFMNALKNSGNRFVHDVITGAEKLDDSWDLYKTLLRTVDFSKVLPEDLMSHLTCLTETDKERVVRTVRHYGEGPGVRELFLRLEGKPPDTLRDIEKGLAEIGLFEKSRDIGEARELVDEIRKKKDEEDDANKTPPENNQDDDTSQSQNNAQNVNSENNHDGTQSDEDSNSRTPSLEEASSGTPSQEVINVVAREVEAAAAPVENDTTNVIDDMLLCLKQPSSGGAVASGDESSQQAALAHYSSHPPDMDPESLNLHDYQTELAEPALRDKNTIIVAPTGSGKTRVAIAIAIHVLQETGRCSQRPHKVIFVVNKVALVEQQKNAFQPFIGDVVGISGDMSSQVPLAEQLTQASVIVLTAQILLNALQDGSFHLSRVGLLIMDECHNTQKGSAYNTIMGVYRDLKQEDPEALLPQVVGLTASLGVKKAKKQKDADDHVLKLCSNLDTEEISTVRKHTESLMNSYHRPIEKTFSVGGRDDQDPFKSVLGEIMERVEQAIFTSNEGKIMLEKKRELREMSSNRGTQQYEGEISKLSNFIPLNVQIPDRARALQDCVNFLEIYNQSLYINRDARTIDAVHYILSYIQTLKDKGQHEGGVMPTLIKLFEAKKDQLDVICRGETNENPVLRKLEDILVQEFREKPKTLAILFTNTRASTQALEAWVQASPCLEHLNPGILTGTGKGGMTQAQQEKLLAMFKEKKHKLVIATSVAEEGLDIQMCNLVVRYNYVRDDIGRVQARGRSRAEGGKFYLIFNARLPHLAERERMNKIRERMMEKATATVRDMIHDQPHTYKQIVQNLQREDRSERTLKKSGTAAAKKRMAAQRIHSEVRLICKHCSEFACYADDVKCINGQHHIVMDEEFQERITKMDLVEVRDLSGDATVTKEIQCKKCRKKWGFSMIYKGHELPLLTIPSLVIEDRKGNKFHAKKWKEVPFKVKAMDLEDLSQRLEVEEEEAAEAIDEKDLE